MPQGSPPLDYGEVHKNNYNYTHSFMILEQAPSCRAPSQMPIIAERQSARQTHPKVSLDLEGKLSYLRCLKFYVEVEYACVNIRGGLTSARAVCTCDRMAGLFDPGFPRTSWRWLVWCGCTIIAMSLYGLSGDAPASAQQQSPTRRGQYARKTQPPKQVKVARVVDSTARTHDRRAWFTRGVRSGHHQRQSPRAPAEHHASISAVSCSAGS